MNTEGLRGELSLDEPLARHTSWRVGGPARSLYRPADAADLAEFLRRLDPDEPLLWLGLGSNLLVADEGFPGTVIETQGCLQDLAAVGDLGIRAQPVPPAPRWPVSRPGAAWSGSSSWPASQAPWAGPWP